jgi:hypothetical protein
VSDLVTSRIFTDGEKGITAAKLNDIVGSSVIQPDFVASKPLASTANPADNLLLLTAGGTYAKAPFSTITSSAAAQIPLADATQNGMLRQVSGLATDVVDGTNHCVPIAGMSGITQMRLRSFNAIGNPNFEVDQRNVGNLVANPSWFQDRWISNKAGTMAFNGGQVAPGGANIPLLPGTSFQISRNALKVLLTTQQASLGASDFLFANHIVEGPNWRELSSDVHSISLLVWSDVANLKFSIALRDSPTTKSLVKLCTIPTPSVWTLITLPNIPVWPSGNFSTTPGILGYQFSICLAAGSTYTAPAADVWQNGNFLGAPGMDNFASKAVNSQFMVAFVQHEPGPLCTTLIDKPFTQNYDECLRYYQKTYGYPTAVGTSNAGATIGLMQSSTTQLAGNVRFIKTMAKAPTVMGYNFANGSANSLRHSNTADYAITSFGSVADSGFATVATATMPAIVAGALGYFHYTADTGW